MSFDLLHRKRSFRIRFDHRAINFRESFRRKES
jgi:hypothetical protein